MKTKLIKQYPEFKDIIINMSDEEINTFVSGSEETKCEMLCKTPNHDQRYIKKGLRL